MKKFVPIRNKIVLGLVSLVVTLGLSAGIASAQSGHFVGTPTCTDEGTVLSCDVRVAGLGSTQFTITVTASQAVADTACRNPGGNIAPGQDFAFTAQGSVTQPTPRNGNARVTLATVTPTPPANSCPNPGWTALVTDVDFGATATIRLFEGASTTPSDTVTVPIQPES
jgi:hypothetical protein